MKMVAAIALAGALGTLTRYWIQGAIQPAGSAYPWGTLLVNVSGSFLLGFLMRYLLAAGWASPGIRAAATVGFCGGYTTMSSFAWETVALARDGEWWRATSYLGVTLVGSLVAITAGMVTAQAVAEP